ncbi:hypothetical protein JAAARDRAFT_33039 [Jaapia argillacea MUCL 33604]|uniref:SnoaL-like domain-containing protein n=1 Tax=Jaapia argillacea MUCL 33604 TaxID=933084 RepID=A0A067Q7L1_9AGAM|nr:hypothetical protein JAAARDRAFT_33039 [Jaapia argillacea MUCL 33604]
MTETHRPSSSSHRRSSSSPVRRRAHSPPSPSFSITHHRSSSLFGLPPLPLPGLVESVAGAGHYSGNKVEHENVPPRLSMERRRSSVVTDVTESRKRLLADLKELYCCRPTMEIFDRGWTRDATFEDPLCLCNGLNEYAAQWFALAKFCSKSENLSSRVLLSSEEPNRLIYTQKQEYTMKLTGIKKVITSMIVIDLDEDDKIVRLVDQWDGEDAPTRWGAIYLRRLNAKIMPWIFRIPKDSR